MKYGNALYGMLDNPRKSLVNEAMDSEQIDDMSSTLGLSTSRDVFKLPVRSSSASKSEIVNMDLDDELDEEEYEQEEEEVIEAKDGKCPILSSLIDIDVDKVVKEETDYYKQLESAGLLETVDLEMFYSNFSKDCFHQFSWHQMGARRFNYHTKTPVELPDKFTIDEINRIELQKANEMTDEDFRDIVTATTVDGESAMKEYYTTMEPKLWEQEARDNAGLPNTDIDKVFHYRLESDKYDPDGAGRALYKDWDNNKLKH